MSDLEKAARECSSELATNEARYEVGLGDDRSLPILIAFGHTQRAAALREAADDKVGPFSGFGMWYLANIRCVLRALADKETQ